MKKILVALDYNPSAEKVAEMGNLLAKAIKADLILVHVIREPEYYSPDYSPLMGFQGSYTTDVMGPIENIKKEAANFLAAIAQHLGGHAIKTKILEGEITEAILEYSKSCNANFIVMGTHRHKGIDRLLIPDVAAHILKHSRIPLLTIPTGDI
jgi:nucleotide-binding universal stress UspA family protein